MKISDASIRLTCDSFSNRPVGGASAASMKLTSDPGYTSQEIRRLQKFQKFACHFRRLALLVAAGIEPLADSLCGSPWRQPRNPARHIGPKALVLRAERLHERRFFVHDHKDMKRNPE